MSSIAPGPCFDEADHAVAVDTGSAPVLGNLDACDGSGAFGWAAHPDASLGAVEVELWVDGKARARMFAADFRIDLADAGVGDGRHAFVFELPDFVYDGAEHEIEVRTVREGHCLKGGPQRMRSSTRPAVTPHGVAGSLDVCDAQGAQGWAAVEGNPAPVELELLVDGVPQGRGLADLMRDDLAAAGIGAGRHGFALRLPDIAFDGQPHLVSVRPVGATHALRGSPLTVRLAACDSFLATSPDDVLLRHARATAAIDELEAMADDELGAREYAALVEMQAWLRTQPFVRSQERVRTQLHRLMAQRCRLEIEAKEDPPAIEGRLTDTWGKYGDFELELVEGDKVLSRFATSAGGRFCFALADDLLDARLHALSIHIPVLAGTLGPWQFLLAKPVPGAANATDPIWGRRCSVKRAAAGTQTKAAPTRLELARAVVDELLAHPNDADSERVVTAMLMFADLLVEAGEWGAARREYARAQTIDPENLQAIVGEIHAAVGLNDEAAAQQLLGEALERFPDEHRLLSLADTLAGRHRIHDARLIAFYLPQFHPTPENNQWWGRGFTEWTNVSAATPLFEDHLQPRRPTSLGFYDLRLPESANAQFDLARRYGIDGFCYYYYWFEGRRILDRPLQDLVEGRTGPFPFCICWANEDWTRSWDGSSGEVLAAQNHTPESDFEFIRDIEPLLRHPDYIRVDGKPMLLIYRADKLAEPQRTVERWREWCRARGIGELHLCAVQSFGFDDPRPLGFDAAVEFPPHCLWEKYSEPPYLTELPAPADLVPGFGGKLYEYQGFARAAMARPREPYALHRTAMAAWDNTARRRKTAHVYHGFTVNTFERWVEHNARSAALEQTDGVCFVNAWNEWAEGTVMEPEAHYGYEILEATRRARARARIAAQPTFWRHGWPLLPVARIEAHEHVVLVGHDAFPAGAQTNLLNMARTLRRQLDTEVSFLLVEGGAMLPEYERVAPTYIVGNTGDWRVRLAPRLAALAARGIRKALCNTVLTGDVAELLKSHGFTVVSLIHEMPALIAAGHMQPQCSRVAAEADALVCASNAVARSFLYTYWSDPAKMLIAPQGIVLNPLVAERDKARAKVRKWLEIPNDSLIVMGCGYGDARKGIDMFVQLASKLRGRVPERELHFVWVGELGDELKAFIQIDIERVGLGRHLHVTGQTKEAPLYFAASDVFALTSREDPFPSVVMEAFDAKMPVVAFDGAGGFVDIVGEQTGALVPYLNVDAMAAAVLALLTDHERRAALGEHNHRLCHERFGYVPYMRKLLALLAGVPADQVAAGHLQRQPWFAPRPRPTISVIVPNYNYAQYLELRLRTILAQTLPPDEIVVLDDASTDGSLEIVNAIAAKSPIPIRVLRSDTNSGNPFVQWARGLEQTSGELVWIAEADDYCEPTLLETLAARLANERVVMAWTDSVMVDENGASRGAPYKAYYGKQYGARWSLSFVTDGRELIDDCLLTENVLPNASAIVFKRSAVRPQDIAQIQAHRFSGDWWMWIALAAAGEVAYATEPLNYHRRHSRSVMGQVLRQGAGLMPETLAFYERLVEHMPELFTPRAMQSVYARLERLYRMFPEHLATAALLDEHPDYAAAMQRLRGSAARAMRGRALPDPASMLVVSADTLGAGGQGVAVLRQLEQEAAAGLRVAVLQFEGDAAVDLTLARRTRMTVLDTADKELPAMLTAMAQDSAVVATYGLSAHAAFGQLARGTRGTWRLIAGMDFDALFAAALRDPSVSVERLSVAVETADTLLFVGDTPPHPFARLAQGRSAPVKRMTLRPVEVVETSDDVVRIVGLADDAPADQWLHAARELAAASDELPQARLVVLHTNMMTHSFQRIHAATGGPEAAFGSPATTSTRAFGNVFLRCEDIADTCLQRNGDTLDLNAFLQSPREALRSFVGQRR